MVEYIHNLKGVIKMSKINEVQQAMITAMKAKEADKKNALSSLLAALKAKAKDKMADLTEEEENAVIMKELKQTKETMDSAPSDRSDIIDECKFRIEIISQFAPKMMDEDEIKALIEGVIAELGVENPTGRERGLIMKNLMPKVAGQADGGLVNKLVSEFIK